MNIAYKQTTEDYRITPSYTFRHAENYKLVENLDYAIEKKYPFLLFWSRYKILCYTKTLEDAQNFIKHMTGS